MIDLRLTVSEAQKRLMRESTNVLLGSEDSLVILIITFNGLGM